MEKDFNIISSNVSEEDKNLFFGPLTGEENFIIIGNDWIMAHILHHLASFPSLSQARKNGWDKPIPNGFTVITIGKKANKKNLFILNMKEN